MFPCIYHDQFYGTYVRTYVAECAVYTDTQNYQTCQLPLYYIIAHTSFGGHPSPIYIASEPQPCIDQVGPH